MLHQSCWQDLFLQIFAIHEGYVMRPACLCMEQHSNQVANQQHDRVYMMHLAAASCGTSIRVCELHRANRGPHGMTTAAVALMSTR
jgi:hypothetical protein